MHGHRSERREMCNKLILLINISACRWRSGPSARWTPTATGTSPSRRCSTHPAGEPGGEPNHTQYGLSGTAWNFLIVPLSTDTDKWTHTIMSQNCNIASFSLSHISHTELNEVNRTGVHREARQVLKLYSYAMN